MENILGVQGLTSSEANHVTNIVKELVKGLDSATLVIASTSVEKNGIWHKMDENAKKDTWVEDIKRVGELYALSAWLKSGIKLKEDMLNNVNRIQPVNVDTPEYLPMPVEKATSFETYVLTLNTKEYNEYLANEAVAAHVGKFVHSFDKIRNQSDNFQPAELKEFKNELVMLKHTRLYTKEELEAGFFELQKIHREAEKIVNSYKAKHKEWVKTVQDEYTKEAQHVMSENNKLRIAHTDALYQAAQEAETKKREERKTISNLKILIPNALQETLDFVNQYAKK